LCKNFSKEGFSLNSQTPESAVFRVEDSELLLSSQALAELTRAVFDKGLSFRFCASGSSMHPFIRNGDIITLSPLSENSPHPGDVVAYVRPETGRFTVHRMVSKVGHAFLISGDNSCGDDGIILRNNILGYVTKVERAGKRVSFGLGPERLLIAFLTRGKLLFPMLRCARFFKYLMARRYHE